MDWGGFDIEVEGNEGNIPLVKMNQSNIGFVQKHIVILTVAKAYNTKLTVKCI